MPRIYDVKNVENHARTLSPTHERTDNPLVWR